MITDELRAWWVHKFPVMDKELHKDFTAIADRIDAEHEKACDDAWDNGYESDYLGIEKWLTEHPQAMEHHGWVELPKDADGEYIHIGDVMEIDGEVFPPVSGIGNGSVIVGVFGVDKDDDISEVFSLDLMRHHQPDTWERIIEDALGSRWSAPDKLSSEFIALVARCKALAGDAE